MKQISQSFFTENGRGWNRSYAEMNIKGYNGSAITGGESEHGEPHPFYIQCMTYKHMLRVHIEKLFK
jgi:hypothetical protein